MNAYQVVTGVIMAGGVPEPGPRAGHSPPGPMADVLGVPLLERNLLAMLKAGIRDVTVLVSGSADVAGSVRRWAERRGTSLARAGGCRLAVVIVLPEAWGSVRALTAVAGSNRSVLQVRADNLTSLDLAALVDAHQRAWADITLSTHEQAFRLPYSVVQNDAGVVTGYQDDPVAAVPVASGVAVLGERALSLLAARSSPAGIADLVTRALDAGLVVRTVEHRSPWINIDDARSLERAEGLVRSDPDAFERCWPEPAPLTAIPGSGGTLVRFDDLDANSRPCRVEVPREPGPGAPDVIDALPAEASARVRAWLAGSTGLTGEADEADDGRDVVDDDRPEATLSVPGRADDASQPNVPDL